MTLPKDYERPIGTSKSGRPRGLTRMIVDRQLLRVPFYKIELVSDSTGKPDKRVNHVEIHPVEWDAKIVFAALKTAVTPVGIPITNIVGVSKVSETKGTFRKKEDLMLKITFRAPDNSERWVIINMEDKYVKEFLNNVQILKQKESDEVYWSLRQTKTVDIYPLAPFLAEGEEIIWHNMKPDPNFKDKIGTLEVLQITGYSYIVMSNTQELSSYYPQLKILQSRT